MNPEHIFLAAWSGLIIIPLLGSAFDAILAARPPRRRQRVLLAGFWYDLEMLP